MRRLPVLLALLVLVLLAAAIVSAQSLVYGTHHLRFTTVSPEAVEPNVPATYRTIVTNASGGDLPAAPMYISHTGSIHSIQPDLGCELQHPDRYYRCTMPPLAAGESLTIDVLAQVPFRYGRASTNVGISYELGRPESSNGGAVFWKDFNVTTTADSGPGSLRQAVLDINAAPECQHRYPTPDTPCRAAFRIDEPVPAEGWYTIRLDTPLPAVRAFDAAVDGTTQTAPNEPAVFLDGASLLSGNGLTGNTGWSLTVEGLAIGGFPWNGIQSDAIGSVIVRRCFIGVDPTGQRAHPNGGRGIASGEMWGFIENNVISGNRRSGIWFMRNRAQSGPGPNILDNRIGVAAHDDTPIGNGASGIFIGPFSYGYTYPSIRGNVIANNAHFGIAITANSPMLIYGNTFRDNGGRAIDINLDGPTAGVKGVPGVEGGVIPPPVILSAVYANGVTTVTGYSLAGNDRRLVLLYASSKLDDDGYAEGEQYLGSTPMQFREDTAFTFVYAGDLRGKYINGNAVAVTQWGWDEYAYTSSELGMPVKVPE